MATANKYYTRTFINKVDLKVIRVFYKCENCKSRIYDDFIPELDNMETVNVFDLLEKQHDD